MKSMKTFRNTWIRWNTKAHILAKWQKYVLFFQILLNTIKAYFVYPIICEKQLFFFFWHRVLRLYGRLLFQAIPPPDCIPRGSYDKLQRQRLDEHENRNTPSPNDIFKYDKFLFIFLLEPPLFFRFSIECRLSWIWDLPVVLVQTTGHNSGRVQAESQQ